MNSSLAEGYLKINPELVTEILCRFIRAELRPGGVPAGRGGAFRRTGFQRGHVPLRRALGPENVLAVTMPYKTSSEATRRDSQAVVDRLGVRSLDVPITDQVDAYFARSATPRNCGWPTSAPASG